jgi:hypothetical protein
LFKTAKAEMDAILMMLAKGVYGGFPLIRSRQNSPPSHQPVCAPQERRDIKGKAFGKLPQPEQPTPMQCVRPALRV